MRATKLVAMALALLLTVASGSISAQETPTPDAPLPSIAADDLRLTPNSPVGIMILLSYLPRADLYLETDDGRIGPIPLSRAGDSPFRPMTESSANWAADYIAYGLTVQSGDWDHPYNSVEGGMILSPDGRTLAMFLCNASGGRGQWCNASRLWLFDLTTGEARQLGFGDVGWMDVYDYDFSDDGDTLIGEGCLNYGNAYFGVCGDTALIAWSVETGEIDGWVITDTSPPF